MASGLWERSGSVFFSTEDTCRPGPFYFLGLNPGGMPDDDNTDEWIGANLFPRSKQNAFYEEWAPAKRGEHPFQKNVRRFLDSLREVDDRYKGMPPDAFIQSICSSNIYFVRTSTFKSVKGHDIFWEIHKSILNDVVRPSCILINDITGYRRMKARLPERDKEDQKIPTEIFVRGKEQVVRYITSGEDKILIGIPHLSPRRPYRKATAANNPVWINKGLPELLEICGSIVKNRPADGCTWKVL